MASYSFDVTWYIILLKIGAPSPVILAKFTDVLEKCSLLSLLPSLELFTHIKDFIQLHAVGHLPLILHLDQALPLEGEDDKCLIKRSFEQVNSTEKMSGR